MNRLVPILLAGTLLTVPADKAMVAAQVAEKKFGGGLLLNNPPVPHRDDEDAADRPAIQPVAWVQRLLEERGGVSQIADAGSGPSAGLPKRITQQDIINAVDADAVQKAIGDNKLFVLPDETGNLLALAKERFPDVEHEIKKRNPKHEYLIVLDASDPGVNANLIITPKGKGKNFLVVSNGFLAQVANYEERPVSFVEQTVRNNQNFKGNRDVPITDKIEQLTLNDMVTPEMIKAGIESGRLLQIDPSDLKAMPENQYNNIVKRKLDRWGPKSPTVILVDTWDNDGASKVNWIKTPPKKGASAFLGRRGGGTQENYLIVSEGAHRWSAEYVINNKIDHEDQVNEDVKKGVLSALFKPDSTEGTLTPASEKDAVLLREVEKIARLENLDFIPAVYIKEKDADTGEKIKDSAPVSAEMRSMRDKEGRLKPFLVITSSARRFYANRAEPALDATLDTVNAQELDAVLGHELKHAKKPNKGEGGDLDPQNIAYRHNLSPEAQRRLSMDLETGADKAAVDLGYGDGLKRVLKEGDAAAWQAFQAKYPGKTREDYEQMITSNPGAHPTLDQREQAIETEQQKLGGGGSDKPVWLDSLLKGEDPKKGGGDLPDH